MKSDKNKSDIKYKHTHTNTHTVFVCQLYLTKAGKNLKNKKREAVVSPLEQTLALALWTLTTKDKSEISSPGLGSRWHQRGWSRKKGKMAAMIWAGCKCEMLSMDFNN